MTIGTFSKVRVACDTAHWDRNHCFSKVRGRGHSANQGLYGQNPSGTGIIFRKHDHETISHHQHQLPLHQFLPRTRGRRTNDAGRPQSVARDLVMKSAETLSKERTDGKKKPRKNHQSSALETIKHSMATTMIEGTPCRLNSMVPLQQPTPIPPPSFSIPSHTHHHHFSKVRDRNHFSKVRNHFPSPVLAHQAPFAAATALAWSCSNSPRRSRSASRRCHKAFSAMASGCGPE